MKVLCLTIFLVFSYTSFACSSYKPLIPYYLITKDKNTFQIKLATQVSHLKISVCSTSFIRPMSPHIGDLEFISDIFGSKGTYSSGLYKIFVKPAYWIIHSNHPSKAYSYINAIENIFEKKKASPKGELQLNYIIFNDIDIQGLFSDTNLQAISQEGFKIVILSTLGDSHIEYLYQKISMYLHIAGTFFPELVFLILILVPFHYVRRAIFANRAHMLVKYPASINKSNFFYIFAYSCTFLLVAFMLINVFQSLYGIAIISIIFILTVISILEFD